MHPSPDHLWQRAETFFTQRDLARARSTCLEILAIDPGYPAAHWLLSRIEFGSGDFRSAVRHALASGQDAHLMHPESSAQIARQLLLVGEYERSHQILSEMAKRDRLGGQVLLDIADQLSILEDQSTALACLDRATAASPDAEISYLRGNILKFLGRFAEAEEAYEKTIAQKANHAYAHWALAHLAGAEGSSRRAERLMRVFKALPALPFIGAASHLVNERAVLGYALFKELDALDDTDSAWNALASAMAMRRRLVSFDAAIEARAFDELAAAYSRDYVSTTASTRADAPVPIFIVGQPRSGTTLLENLLGRHPGVAICGELNDLRMQYKRTVNHYSAGFLDAEAIRRLPGCDAAELGESYLQHTAWRRGDAAWFTDKHPGNFVFSGLVMKALPNGRIVHMRRDAMDCAFSNLKELFSLQFYPHSYSLDDMASHIANYGKLMRHVDTVAEGRVLDVRYEDLVDETPKQLSRVHEFCGLPAAGEDQQVAREMAVSTASSVQVREAVHQRSVGGWRRYERQLSPMAEKLLALGVAV